MILSRRSLLIGSGAAFIARPAQALILPQRYRNPFAFPGGVLPGVNRAHFAAGSGLRYSGVAGQGGAYINLLTGKPSTPVGTNTFGSTIIGPAITTPTSGTNGNTFSSPITETPTAVTYAAILIAETTGNFEVIFKNANCTFYVQVGTPKIAVGQIISGFAMTSGVPYFVAVSLLSATTVNFVETNLLTGGTKTSTSATTNTLGSTAGTWSINGANAVNDGGNTIAAAMYSANNFLSLRQLVAWGADPWSFWYPSTLRDQLLVGQ